MKGHSRYVPGAEEYLAIFNSKAFHAGKQIFDSIEDAQGVDDKIQMNIEVIKNNVIPSNKRLHFFSDSALPAELQGLPNPTYKLTNLDYPAVAALGAVLSYMEEFPLKKPYRYKRPPPPHPYY